jgi:hypothetical protein
LLLHLRYHLLLLSREQLLVLVCVWLGFPAAVQQPACSRHTAKQAVTPSATAVTPSAMACFRSRRPLVQAVMYK